MVNDGGDASDEEKSFKEDEKDEEKEKEKNNNENNMEKNIKILFEQKINEDNYDRIGKSLR